MTTFLLACHDKANSLDLRMATREAHLAYARQHTAIMKLAGPFLTAAGDMCGSLIILEAPDEAAVRAFNLEDPYTKAGLWDRVEITAFKATLGGFKGD